MTGEFQDKKIPRQSITCRGDGSSADFDGKGFGGDFACCVLYTYSDLRGRFGGRFDGNGGIGAEFLSGGPYRGRGFFVLYLVGVFSCAVKSFSVNGHGFTGFDGECRNRGGVLDRCDNGEGQCFGNNAAADGMYLVEATVGIVDRNGRMWYC